QLERHLPRIGKRAFAADQHVRQIDLAISRVWPGALRMKYIQVVAAYPAHDGGYSALDFTALAFGYLMQARHDSLHTCGRALHSACLAKACRGAVQQHRINADHVMDHIAVGDRARATGVVARHTAQGALRSRTDIDWKPDAMWFEPGIQVIQHDAGFDRDGHAFQVELDDAIQVFAVVDDQRGAYCLAALRCAAASCQNGHR